MRESEYRAWLCTQGYKDSSITTWLSDGRKVESHLGDLDADFEADGCAGILEKLAYSAADQRDGRPNPTTIPLGGKLYAQLATLRSAVSAYRRFRLALQGQGGGLPAGLTREAVLAELEAHDRAGSTEAYLSKFSDLGNPQSWWLVHGGRRYPAKAIVHGALGLTERRHDAGQCRQMLGALGFFVMDARAYAEIRATFLRRMDPFTSFRQQSGPYWDIERAYKEELIGEVREIAASGLTDDEAGQAILRKLTVGQQGVPLNWMIQDSLLKADPGVRGPALAALGQLARSEAGAEEAMLEAAAVLERTRDAGVGSMALGSVMGIVISIYGTRHPEQACWFKIRRIRDAGKRLFDRKLFAGGETRAEDLAEFSQMMRVLFDLLEQEEGWQPIDLFDVQGFLWVGLASAREWNEAETTGADNATPIWLVAARWGEHDKFARYIESCEWSLPDGADAANERRIREMAPGDCIVLRDYLSNPQDLPFKAPGRAITAMRIRAIGTITERREDGLSVAVDWTELDTPRTWYFYTHPQAVWRLKNPGEDAYADRLRQFILTGEAQDLDWFLNDPAWRLQAADSHPAEQPEMSEPTNLILYGPPGTGKTYATALEAVRLCDGAVDYPTTAEGRAALMQRYGELRDAGRIEFVTFHQSFSYEDFVEGLRPETGSTSANAAGGFRLEPKAGVFRKICSHCGMGSRSDAERISLAGRSIYKMSLGEAGKAEWAWVFDQAIAEGYAYLGFADIDWTDPRFADKQAILEACEAHRGNLGQFTDGAPLSFKSGPVKSTDTFRNQVKTGDVIVVSKGLSVFRAIGIVTGEYEYAPNATGAYSHRRKVDWLWHDSAGLDVKDISAKQFSMETIHQLKPENLRVPVIEGLVNIDEEAGNAGTLPHVLIIDEINRANVSKVFGELITLIEPDKRLGRANALTVRLPYSEETFGVPANLHIIGTMNTADRSIALLDTALRRRFQFREIAPEPDLLKAAAQRTGVDLPAVLRTINDRIEYLVDRDHRIGHAFFIGCTTRAEVDAAMRDRVIPLLQEYFFEDWARFAAVVGEGFIEQRVLPAPPGIKYGEPKTSWSVREEFSANAYATLLGKGGEAGLAGVDEEGERDADDPLNEAISTAG